PAVFDIARQLETQPESDASTFTALTEAQNQADDLLYQLFVDSFALQTADQAASAPVHQLFYHRLTGGRMDRFYGDGTAIALPDGSHQLGEVFQIQWKINGINFEDTLAVIIERAIRLLNPSQAGYSIIGHGDAHNGNVFFNETRRLLTYFDPAFAGQHHPLLDLTKPLFHNVFAMWMYFPQEERERLKISLHIDGQNRWRVEHNYHLNPVRQMFLRSKVDRTLIPVLQYMKKQEILRNDWGAYLKAALFCCPFLTMDLKRFPREIALLGLTMAIEMGAESGVDDMGNRSVIDSVLDEAEQAL
ncbi:MAG TPA: phosphotransferase, partial [Phototrophicaceae bacterium]|nr:phosphotransferase [Phototrophicaceae bacterium]